MKLDRLSKAMAWLAEPDKHIHSVLIDEDGVSAVVIGETGEYLVGINGADRQICGCRANQGYGILCSHIIFFIGWLAMRGIGYR